MKVLVEILANGADPDQTVQIFKINALLTINSIKNWTP